MRSLSLAPLLLVLVHCSAPRPLPPGLTISLEARPQVRVQGEAKARSQEQAAVEAQAQTEALVHGEAEALVHGEAEVQVQIEARPQVRTRPGPPPPPRPAVPLEQAEVVEFFGIPLDDAQDVVFVLDRSGSMAASARGRIAQLGASAAPPAAVDAQAPAPARSDDHDETLAPVDPYADEESPEEAAEPGLVEEPAEALEPPPPPSKLAVAHHELVEALERLPAGTRVNVLYFNHQLEAFAVTLFPLEEQSRAELIDFVTGTVPTGSTALGPAMRTAFLMNARRIVLLSDGLGNVGGGASAVLRDAREAMRGGVRIDTIGLGHGQDYDLLRALAHESGGLYQAL